MTPAGPEADLRPRPARTSLLLPWAAMLFSSLALAGLGRLAAPADPPAPAEPMSALALAVAALGVACVVAVLALDRSLLSPGRLARRLPAPDPALAERYVLAGHLALWSIAGLPAILGFSHLLLGGPLRIHLALCALSLGLLALLMPTKKRIGTRLDAVLKSAQRGQASSSSPG